jgi:hypothetical protein
MTHHFGFPSDGLLMLAEELEATATFRKKPSTTDGKYNPAYCPELLDAIACVSNHLKLISPLFEQINDIATRINHGDNVDDEIDALLETHKYALQGLCKIVAT